MSCFVVYKSDGMYACTTRKIGDSFPFGFPGGKVKESETLKDCVFRECKEEGWIFQYIEEEYFYKEIVDNHPVYYFRAFGNYFKLSEYDEKNKITPIFLEKEDIEKCFNNKTVIEKYTSLKPLYVSK